MFGIGAVLRLFGMREDQHQFLALAGNPPARLTVEQVAWMLGCQTHDVPILVSSRMLKPLGNPPQNGTKFFAAIEIAEAIKDRTWLSKMTQTICQHWQKRNAHAQTHKKIDFRSSGMPADKASIPLEEAG